MPGIKDSVIVITGASSGLGRATALELARRGGRLVLAARRQDALETTAEHCRAVGAEAIVVPTDVTRESEVQKLLAAALDTWGTVDVWINNAGVTLYGLLEQGPVEQHQRVIETNLYGSIHGARAVVPVFRRQHRGVLINIGSVLSGVGQAFVPSYVISKFGVHGLSEALRVELADEPDIHICSVFPYAIDTQHFQVAANLLERAPFAMPPVQSPEKVARVIAEVVERPRRSRYVPRWMALGLVAHAIAPRISERLLLASLRRWHLSALPQHTGTGNLFAPPRELAHTHGDRRPLVRLPIMIAWMVVRAIRLQLAAVLGISRRATAGSVRGQRAL